LALVVSSAYTRTTKKSVLVLRRLWGEPSISVNALTVVPVSKVLRELPCDVCHRDIERGELVLRERRGDYFITTCDLCAKWTLLEDLL